MCSDDSIIVTARPANPHLRPLLKPIRSGFIYTKGGEAVHIRCRTHQLHLETLDQEDRARRALERATDLVEETRRRRPAQDRGLTRQDHHCPVCRWSATLTDWRPHLNWMTVEDCPCDRCFVWTPLLDDGRLDRLTRGLKLPLTNKAAGAASDSHPHDAVLPQRHSEFARDLT